MNLFLPYGFGIGRFAVTAVLIMLLFFVIRHDYVKVKDTLWSDMARMTKNVDPDKVKIKAMTTSLDTYRPDSFAILMKIIDVPSQDRAFALKEHVDYYEKIIRYRPYQLEAYVLLGFCYYYEGRSDEAIAVFQRAAQLNPAFFWPYYNLGAIYFNQRDYTAAVQYFKRAVLTDPLETLKTVSRSHIYMEILSREEEVRDHVATSLAGHYQRAYEALLLSERYQKHGLNSAAEEIKLSFLPVRFF